MCIDSGPPCRTKCTACCRALVFDCWSWLFKLSTARLSVFISKLRGALWDGGVFLFLFFSWIMFYYKRTCLIMILKRNAVKCKASVSSGRSELWLCIDLLMYLIPFFPLSFVSAASSSDSRCCCDNNPVKIKKISSKGFYMQHNNVKSRIIRRETHCLMFTNSLNTDQ